MKKHIAIAIICALSMLAVTSCGKVDKPNNVSEDSGEVKTTEEPAEMVDGGQVKNSYDAPTVIESKDIEAFSTYFYLWDQFDETVEGGYSFAISKNDKGEYELTEDSHYNISVTVDKDILGKLQAIIDDNELAKMNGFDEHTAGLPEEFAPCMLSVTYESGETLYFSEDNDPEAKWSHEMWELFKNEFINRGHDELLPPVEDTTLVRFDMGYTDGVKDYTYSTIFTEDDKDEYSHHFLINIYNRETDEVECDKVVEIPENFYEELAEELDSLKLKKYQNGEATFGGNSELDSYAFFTMEMLSGLQVNAYYEGEDAKELTEVLIKLAEYMDGIFFDR